MVLHYVRLYIMEMYDYANNERKRIKKLATIDTSSWLLLWGGYSITFGICFLYIHIYAYINWCFYLFKFRPVLLFRHPARKTKGSSHIIDIINHCLPYFSVKVVTFHVEAKTCYYLYYYGFLHVVLVTVLYKILFASLSLLYILVD